MARLGQVVACLTFAALAAACSSEPVDEDVAPTPGTDAPADLKEFRVAGMLAEMPAQVRTAGQPFTLYTGDLAQASERAGLERPTSTAEAPVWVSNLGGVGVVDGWPPVVFVPLEVPLAGPSPANLVDEELGWSVVDVDQFIMYKIASNAHTLIAHGSFDDHTLDNVRQMAGRIRSAGQAADLDDELEQATPARPLGVPLRMAVDDERLMASTYTDVVQAWLAGPRETLAEDPLLGPIASTLDERNVYSALVVTPSELGSHGLPEFLLEDLGMAADDFPYFDTYAIGWSFEGDQASVTVVYHAPDGVSTNELGEKVADRWHGTNYRGENMSTLVNVGRISTEGRNVVVTMTPADRRDPGIVFRMHESQDLPFLSS